RRRHTRSKRDWSSDVCSSDLNGLLMDLKYAEVYGNKLNKRITELEELMYENWGDVNTNSPKQLKELLYDELGYKDYSGKGSTNAKVLKQLAKEHRSEEHTSELQSRFDLVCRLLLEKR